MLRICTHDTSIQKAIHSKIDGFYNIKALTKLESEKYYEENPTFLLESSQESARTI